MTTPSRASLIAASPLLVVYSLGATLGITGFLFFLPLPVCLIDPAERIFASAFLFPGIALVAGGGLAARLASKGRKHAMTVPEGSAVVTLAWIIASLASAYAIGRCTGLDFTRSFFEAVSGWTTTGLSVVDVTKAPRMLLLWRSLMQLAGGAGLAIIMVAAIPFSAAMGLSLAEGRSDQLVPNVGRSAKLVLRLYLLYAFAGTVAYRLAGMSWFDAVNHSFSAVSTGGFSTRPESIGYWDSAVVEAVTFPLMILGNMNFLTAYLLFQGKFRAVLKNGEVRVWFFLIVSGAAVLFFSTLSLYPRLPKHLRVAFFETATALTTTGYSTVSYNGWSGTAHIMLIILMLVGGGICSTAGGIKQYRVHLLFRSVVWTVRQTLLPRGAVSSRLYRKGEDVTDLKDAPILQAGTFVFLYFLVLFFGVLVLTSHGYGLQEALFEYASALGTVGLSVGVTSADAPGAVLWVEIAGMLLGRLEFFVLFTALGALGRRWVRR